MSGRRALIGEALFGAFDGLMTALGVVLGADHASSRVILQLAASVSVASAMSMGVGTVVSDNEHGWREGTAMGGATLVGTFLPVLPILLLPLGPALVGVAVVALAVAAVIATARGSSETRRSDFAVSYLSLALVAIPTIGVALAFGPVG